MIFEYGTVYPTDLNLLNRHPFRLLWALEKVPALRKAAESGDAMFGTLDTWLLYRLTGGATYVSEISNASATGLFDPFTVSWGAFVFKMLGIPMSLAPPVVSSAGRKEEHTQRVKIPFGVSSEFYCYCIEKLRE